MTLLIAFLLMNIQPIQGYRGIVPLVSTRKDVEKLFGKPSDPARELYYFRDETVSLRFPSTVANRRQLFLDGRLRLAKDGTVPADTVLTVRVTLRKQVPLDSLHIDLTTFKKVRGDPDVASHYKYVDEEAGVTIDLNGDGTTEMVRGYIYQPQAKYKYLGCSQR